jgi:hypothetical protein
MFFGYCTPVQRSHQTLFIQARHLGVGGLRRLHDAVSSCDSYAMDGDKDKVEDLATEQRARDDAERGLLLEGLPGQAKPAADSSWLRSSQVDHEY